MNVRVTRCCMVQSIDPTFNGRMPLTESDQIGVLTHVPTIYFYRPSQNWLHSNRTIFTTLQTSLAKALVYFYPLAGRLRRLDGARFELDCNNSGAQLIEAESDATLDDLGDFTQSSDFQHHLIPKFNYSFPIEEIPLLSTQITKFRCGGITLGYSISHAVVDGRSALHFISEWARLARGESLGAAPFLDRRLLRAGEPPSAPPRFEHPQFDPPPLLLGRSSSEEERERATTTAMLKISKMQVEMLKKEANRGRACDDEDSARAYSRYEGHFPIISTCKACGNKTAIAGHIWRCACRARGHEPEQPTALVICVDVRMQPRLPENFFGNAVIHVIAQGRSGELAARPLGYAAGRIREAVEGVTSEYVHLVIDLVKNMEDLSRHQDIHALTTGEVPFHGNPNIGVLSWMSLLLHDVDFGWGKEIFMAPGAHGCDGDSLILPACDGDGDFVVALCLQVACMDDFKKYFYHEI